MYIVYIRNKKIGLDIPPAMSVSISRVKNMKLGLTYNTVILVVQEFLQLRLRLHLLGGVTRLGPHVLGDAL